MGMGRFDRSELEAAFYPEHHGQLPDDPEWFYRQHYNPQLSPLKCIQKTRHQVLHGGAGTDESGPGQYGELS